MPRPRVLGRLVALASLWAIAASQRLPNRDGSLDSPDAIPTDDIDRSVVISSVAKRRKKIESEEEEHRDAAILSPFPTAAGLEASKVVPPEKLTTIKLGGLTTNVSILQPDGKLLTPVVVLSKSAAAAAPYATFPAVPPPASVLTVTWVSVVTTVQKSTVQVTQPVESGPWNPRVVVTINGPETSSTVTAPAETPRIASPITGAETNGSSQNPVVDLAQGGFLGGMPNTEADLPVTIIFLILFLLGAYTHISIFRANRRCGHKFLISELVFDFCMVRSVTCTLRIIWIFNESRIVTLLAQIFQFGGAVVLFVVNVFFVQRIVRSMHPRFGWTEFFRYFTIFMAFSAPAVALSNTVSISIAFYSFSADHQDRLKVAIELLKFGSAWGVWLDFYPVLALFVCACFPGPPIEHFGEGSFRSKVATMLLTCFMLGVGAAMRLYSIANPAQPGTEESIPTYTKATFYTTQFFLEVFVVVVYAAVRIDKIFWVPNGCTKAGDYSRPYLDGNGNPIIFWAQIGRAIEEPGLSSEIIKPPDFRRPQGAEELAGAVLCAGKRGDSTHGRPSERESLLQRRPGVPNQEMSTTRFPDKPLQGHGMASMRPTSGHSHRAPQSSGYDDGVSDTASEFGDAIALKSRPHRPTRRPNSRGSSVMSMWMQRASVGGAPYSSPSPHPLSRKRAPGETDLTSWIRATASRAQEQGNQFDDLANPLENSALTVDEKRRRFRRTIEWWGNSSS